MTIRRKGATGIAAATLAVMALPALASAATRYAAPTGDNSNPACPKADPCDLEQAIEGATDGDQVIVRPGSYGSAGSPLTSEIQVAGQDIAIRGPASGPRARIYSSAGFAVMFGGDGSSVSDLKLIHSGANVALYSFSGVRAERMVVRSDHGTACSLVDGVTIADSVCESGTDVGASLAVGSTAPEFDAARLRNVTAVSGTSYGILAAAGSFAHLTITAWNTIAQGGGSDVGARVDGTMGSPSADVELFHSNYSSVDEIGGGTVTPAGSGANQTASPLFANSAAHDFHEISGSPTIDSGFTPPENGPLDFDREKRKAHGTIDIGADEFASSAVTCGGRDPTLLGDNFGEDLTGSSGRDVIIGFAGADAIHSLGGDDYVCAGVGEDVAFGGGGDDRLSGQGDADGLRGEGGRDGLNGGSGSPDECVGGPGRDRTRTPGCEVVHGIP